MSFPISRGCPYSLAYVPLFSVFKASLVGPSLHHGATSLILSCESLCYRPGLFFSVNTQSNTVTPLDFENKKIKSQIRIPKARGLECLQDEK